MPTKKKIIVKEHDDYCTKYGIGTVIHMYTIDKKWVVVEFKDYIKDVFIGDILGIIPPKKINKGKLR